MDKNKLFELTNKIYRTTLLFPKKEPLRYKMREIADEVLSNLIIWGLFHSSNSGKFSAVENFRLEQASFDQTNLGLAKQKDLIFEIEKDLEILGSYFEIAKWQNWVSYFDVLEIEEKYDKIKCDFKKEIEDLEKKERKEVSEKDILLEINKIARGQASGAGEKNQSRDPIFAVSVNSSTDEIKNSGSKAIEDSRQSRDKNQGPLDQRKEKILEILEKNGRAQVWEVKEILPEVSKRTLRRDFNYLLKKGLVERIGERNNTFYQLKR